MPGGTPETSDTGAHAVARTRATATMERVLADFESILQIGRSAEARGRQSARDRRFHFAGPDRQLTFTGNHFRSRIFKATLNGDPTTSFGANVVIGGYRPVGHQSHIHVLSWTGVALTLMEAEEGREEDRYWRPMGQLWMGERAFIRWLRDNQVIDTARSQAEGESIP
jgi:hypothetical protein